MNNIYAVVDIGTLKVKTEVSSVNSDGTLNRIYNSNNLTRFGIGLDENNGYVQETYIQATIEELKRLKSEFKRYKVTKFRIVSTHAMRKAKNKQEIISRIKNEVGFEVENIPQEQEAELFFKAVMQTFPSNYKKYGVIDVGGGSVQVLVGTKENLMTKYMMPTGTVSLHEKYVKDPNDPLSYTTSEDIEKMKSQILEEIIKLEISEETPLIYGSSMIIDVMKALNIPLDSHLDSSMHPYKTYSKHLSKFLNEIIKYNPAERGKLYPQLPHGYEWGIDKAFINVLTIASRLNSPYIIPSNANIAQGIIYSMV